MIDAELVARQANRIAGWLSLRDVSDLTRAALENEAGLHEGAADLFVLFGGGVVGSVDVLAAAMRASVAQRYAIVGGRGHATYWLDRACEHEFAQTGGTGLSAHPGQDSEAELLDALLTLRHGLHADLLETHSTNCGNNITYLMDLLEGEQSIPQSVILCQDATMQRRMDATWRRQAQERPAFANTTVINWASYDAMLGVQDGAYIWTKAPEGMWLLDRYFELLVGEVDRLTDDAHGYGPRGSDFIAHVDVPSKISDAAFCVRKALGGAGRPPDERWQ